VQFVYILRCADGTFYVGHTDDLELRLIAHNEGRGATHTRSRRPVVMAYSELHASLLSAVQRERQIKRWTRAKKEALIAGDLHRLKAL
jgi:predicted GIY-YIG superfamily endonuclease